MQTGLQWFDERAPDLIELAQTIWEHPEVGLKEERAAAAHADFLRREGFDVRQGVAGMPTALVASFGQGGPVIGFLGEYDALPGLSQRAVPTQEAAIPGGPGQGCGHNLLGVASLGAAVALGRELAAGRLPGTVRYYGCPAEETLVGKVFMAKAGAFDDLDAALTWHPGSVNGATWSSCLAMNSARFAFRGRAAHAAGAPHLGISALDAVELMNVGVNFLREHVIQEARIHYVITRGGSEPNVVPPLAEVWYYVRAPRRADVEEIYQRVVKVAEGASLMTGAELSIEFQTGCHEYLPNPAITEVLEESLRRVGAPRFTDEEHAFARELEKSFAPGQKASSLRASDAPRECYELTLHEKIASAFDRGRIKPISTDVGDVSWVAPTGQISAATWNLGTAPHTWQAAAASGMGIGHKGMLVAAKALALAGHELAMKPDLLARARAAFVEATGGRPYQCPLPPDMVAPLAQLRDH